MALYQHRFIGRTALGTNFMHTWWSDFTDPDYDVEAANADAVGWIEALMAGLATWLPESVGYTSVSTSQVDTDDLSQVARYDTAVSLFGSETAEAPLPAEVAVVVSLTTATPTRSGRGRFYLPQLHAGALSDDGRISTAAVTAIVGAVEAAFASLPTEHIAVVWSRTQRESRPITGFNVGNLWDTIRGRDARAIETRVTGEV